MRVFIGVKTDCEDQLLSLQQELMKLGKGSFTSRANMHMTLKFLGEVSPAKLDDICQAITEVQRGSLRLTCEGLQIFGRDIVSAKVGGEKDKLSALYDSLETALEKRGFEKETRRFRPHITLARKFRPSAGFDISGISVQHTEFQVNEVILFESTRVDGKLIYKPLVRHPVN